MDEKELLEKSIYLETTTALSRFEVMKKKTVLDIDFLTNSILRKKYLIGEDIPVTEVAKIEALSPAFRHLRDNMLEEDKEEYLAEISVEEEKLAKLKEYLESLEEDIKKSKTRLANLKNGILPDLESDSKEDSKDREGLYVAAHEEPKDDKDLVGGGAKPTTEEDKDDSKAVAGATDSEFPTAGEDKGKEEALAAMKEAAKDGPVEVGSVVKPKKKLWTKLAIALGLVGGFIGALVGLNKVVNKPDSGTYQRSNQQQPWKPIADLTPVEPIGPLTPLPDTRPVVPYTPSTPAEPDVTPTPADPTPSTPTPVTPTPVEPTPTPTPQDTFVQPKLAPGVTIMNMEDGVERTNSGDSYVHSDEGTRRGDHVDLDRDSEGHGLVTEEQLAPQTPAPAIPQTGQEQTYEQFMDNATPEEARVVNESIAGVDWEALMAEEEAGLTLTR